MPSPRAHYIADEAASGDLRAPGKLTVVQCPPVTTSAGVPPGASPPLVSLPTAWQRWVQRLAASRWMTPVAAPPGRLREHPLTALRESDRFALVASNFGRSRFPGWYYNLRGRPDAQIRLAGRQTSFHARPASPEEHALFWAIAVHLYPGYVLYERRAAAP